MKKLLIIFYILLFFISGLHGKEVITLAIGEWAPYTSSTEKNGKTAEDIANAQELANRFDKGLLERKGTSRYDEIIDEFMFK